MAAILEDHDVVDCDRVLTASELTAVYRNGLDVALARFVQQQSMLVGEPILNRQLNEASADYYQWLIDTGGDAAVVSDAYAIRLSALEHDPERIARLRLTVESRATNQPAVNPTMINRAVLKAGLPLNKTNYDIVRRQLWLAYRDAARSTEGTRLHEAGLAPYPDVNVTAAPHGFQQPQSGAATSHATPSPISDTEPRKRKSIEEAMEDCIAAARPHSGIWPSEVQVRTAIRLLIHVVGPNVPIDEVTQFHIGQLAQLMKDLPNRWGRTAAELKGGVVASLERAKELDRAEVGVSNATQAKHLTWVQKVISYAKRHGYGPAAALEFRGFDKDNREPKVRARELRAKWAKEEIARLLEAPIFTGCAGLRDIERLKPGGHIFHDGWYFVPLLTIHIGNRSAELVGMPMCDVHEDDDIPHFVINFHKHRRIKNVQSKRSLPVHPELIRLGFLDYIRAIRADEHEMLFPEFHSPNSGSFASSFYKKVFRDWRDWSFPDGTSSKQRIGGANKDKDLIGFRGRAGSEMQAKEVPTSVIADILGHEHAGTTEKDYLIGTPLSVMLDAMKHTTHLTETVVAVPINMRPKNLRAFGATAGVGGRPQKTSVQN